MTGAPGRVWVFYVQPLPGALVSSYLPAVVPATPGSAVLPAGMVAVPAAGLSAVPSGAAPAAGTLMVFCHPVVTAPAVVRRDGGAGGRGAGGSPSVGEARTPPLARGER